MSKIAAILIGCMFIAGCDDSLANDIAHTVVSTGLQTGINSQQIRVVKNSTEYANLLSGVQLLGAIPNPDFTESMLVGIFTTLNSCYTYSISSVKKINGSIVITVNIASENVGACDPVLGNGYLLMTTAHSTMQVSVLFEEL